MSAAGIQALLDVSLSYINESRDSAKSSLLMGITDSGDYPKESLTENEIKIITEALLKLFNNKINLVQACQIINPIVGTQHPMQRVAGILSIKDEPIPPNPHEYMDNISRHRTRPWMLYEDQRLLAAILRYGFENWVMIAEFVGNGRTRSQCSQRWNRGLNPKISKGTWSKEEEEKLMRLVSENGDKSWTKISMEFGNRSDVQCRYRYQQLIKDNQMAPTENNSSSPKDEADVNNDISINEKETTEQAPTISEPPLKSVESEPKIDDIKIKKESRIQIPSLIPFHDQLQNQINLQAELPKLYIQQAPSLPSITSNPAFFQQSQIQSKSQSQQDNSALPKISLPKIDPSIFMEC